MGRNKSLSPTKRAQILAYSRCGNSQRNIAALLGVSQVAVHQALKKYQQTGSFTDAKRSGRPCKTSPRADRVLGRAVKNQPRITLKSLCGVLEKSQISLHLSTISRRLKRLGLQSYRP